MIINNGLEISGLLDIEVLNTTKPTNIGCSNGTCNNNGCNNSLCNNAECTNGPCVNNYCTTNDLCL